MIVIHILQVLWILPVVIPWWYLVVLPLWLAGLIRPESRRGWATVFRVTRKWGWWIWLWQRIPWGCGMPLTAIVRWDISLLGVNHECRHVEQWMWFGPLMPLAYAIGFRWLEADARAHEGRA